MPINYQQIQPQILEMGRQAPMREAELKELLLLAREALARFASQPDFLQQCLERALETSPELRCAGALDEVINQAFDAPVETGDYVLLAADGSQINPDRHAAVDFGVINVGMIRMQPGSSAAPSESVNSRLLFHEALYRNGAPLTEDLVALMRDLSERRELAEAAAKESTRVVTLTDGPLELFREPKNSAAFDEEFRRYAQVMADLAALKVVTAGYVDRPRSDLVVRLLEIALQAMPAENGAERPAKLTPWVKDMDLFAEILAPGQRSAVFHIQSPTASKFTGCLALRFFYLNVGRPGRPYLARVEIPLWVVEQAGLLDLLHGSLLAQCARMGAQPYPYGLHRAHEIAVVSLEEKENLEAMICAELTRRGIPVQRKSYKQGNKELTPRTRL